MSLILIVNFHHWLHRKLSFWQLSVQPVVKITSKWQHLRFGDLVFSVLPWLYYEFQVSRCLCGLFTPEIVHCCFIGTGAKIWLSNVRSNKPQQNPTKLGTCACFFGCRLRYLHSGVVIVVCLLMRLTTLHLVSSKITTVDDFTAPALLPPLKL